MEGKNNQLIYNFFVYTSITKVNCYKHIATYRSVGDSVTILKRTMVLYFLPDM